MKSYMLSDFIHEGRWSILIKFNQEFLELAMEISSMDISDNDEDEIVRGDSDSGELATGSAYNFYREKGAMTHWMKGLWQSYIPP